MYGAEGSQVDMLIFEAETVEEQPTSICFSNGNIISPVCDAQLILHTPDYEDATVLDAVYGCLPNGTVVIAIHSGVIPDSVVDAEGLIIARVILDPYCDEDEHIVEDVVLNLLNEE